MNYSTVFLVFACIGIVLQSILLYLALFEPGLDYHIKAPHEIDLDSPEFLHTLEALADAKIHHECCVEVLTNGENYYEAELAAIRQAKHSVNLEAYIFKRGRVGESFIQALTERARAGVKVNLVIDAIGSFTSWESFFKDLRAAGGRVVWYHRISLHNVPRINNRTHRELLIVDGRVGFIGGAGFADHWLYPPNEKRPRWRDTMCRVTGTTVTGLQATFSENWLEASGEILDASYFPLHDKPLENIPEHVAAMVVNSSPSMGRSTRARILYGSLLAAASKEICATTPYFLPDRAARDEMIQAIKERDVKIKIIVPGEKIDHTIVRRSSRRLYGDLLKAGAEIYEYQPGMIHTKSLVVDDLWSVIGSTNLDNRSFGLNDEVNLAVREPHLAARLKQDFEIDLSNSRRVTYDEWRKRPFTERIIEQLGRIIERQQ